MDFKFTNMKTINNKKKIDEVNKITPQQQEFVNKVASGDSATTAYVNVYNCKKERLKFKHDDGCNLKIFRSFNYWNTLLDT